MEKLTFKTVIDAPREKVWKILWGESTYPKWTAVFSEGSIAKTDWKKGSKVLFLNAANEGMVSTIAGNIPNEYMSFKHLGTVKDGVETTESDETKSWAGAMENYTLMDVNGKTELTVDMDVTDDFKDYFVDTIPKALEEVKNLATTKTASV